MNLERIGLLVHKERNTQWLSDVDLQFLLWIGAAEALVIVLKFLLRIVAADDDNLIVVMVLVRLLVLRGDREHELSALPWRIE